MQHRVVPIIALFTLLCGGIAVVRWFQDSQEIALRQAKNRALLEAVRRGDAMGVRQALATGGDANASTEPSHPSLAGLLLGRHTAAAPQVLYAAARDGNASVVQELLMGGANPNLRGPDGRTPLIEAALAGHLPVVRALLEHRADIDAVDENGDTALILSLQSDQGMPIARYLIAHGADVRHRGKDGDTALSEALIGHRNDLVLELLKRGADPNIRGIDPAGSFRIHDMTWPNAGGTALIWASRNSETEVMNALLDHGADISATDSQGRTALMWAAFGNHADAVRLLLRRGANPGVQDANGQTALHISRAVGASAAERELQHTAKQ